MCAKPITILSNRARHENSNVLYVIGLNDEVLMDDYGTVRDSLLLDSIDFQLIYFVCDASDY